MSGVVSAANNNEIWNQVDIAWIAGIIEGEGSISLHPRATIKVKMTDHDIIKRLHTISGIGHFNGPYKTPPHKDSWVWHVSDAKNVARLLLAVYPLLGERRRQPVNKVTDYIVELSKKNRSYAESKNPTSFDPRCGTIAGRGRHQYLNELPCQSCKGAMAAYAQNWRASK